MRQAIFLLFFSLFSFSKFWEAFYIFLTLYNFSGFLGPWSKYTDDAGSAKPGEEDAAYLEDYLSKMKKRSKKTQEETPMEEKSTLHIKDAYDYQGLYFFFHF